MSLDVPDEMTSDDPTVTVPPSLIVPVVGYENVYVSVSVPVSCDLSEVPFDEAAATVSLTESLTVVIDTSERL